VLQKFYRQLTPDQLSTIKVVTGDGAKWITDCVNEFTPDCERCVDPFHVVEWAMDALDEVRREAWRDAHEEAKALSKANPRGKGRPRKDDPVSQEISAAKAKAYDIKGSTYALGKAPENLTDKQRLKVEMIAQTDNRLYRAYLMKERLRLIFKIRDVDEAEAELDQWLWWASHSRIDAFKELYRKIKRHKSHIEHDQAWDEQRTDRSYKQQDQTDHSQGLWFPKHPEYAGYGISGLLRSDHSTS